MMTEPPKPKGQEDICPICNRPRRQHTPKETLECSQKIRELYDSRDKGEGV